MPEVKTKLLIASKNCITKTCAKFTRFDGVILDNVIGDISDLQTCALQREPFKGS